MIYNNDINNKDNENVQLLTKHLESIIEIFSKSEIIEKLIDKIITNKWECNDNEQYEYNCIVFDWLYGYIRLIHNYIENNNNNNKFNIIIIDLIINLSKKLKEYLIHMNIYNSPSYIYYRTIVVNIIHEIIQILILYDNVYNIIIYCK